MLDVRADDAVRAALDDEAQTKQRFLIVQQVSERRVHACNQWVSDSRIAIPGE